jgi:glycosyltransferase involved in cell wall biosynthesis
MTIKYSICMTNYNNKERCINSILNQVDSNFEIMVVDNTSNDGLEKILSEMAERGIIHLIRRRCSREKGRQIALESSFGDYIIAQMDTEEEFNPVLPKFLNSYHSMCDGKVLVAIDQKTGWRQNITVAPRKLLIELGEWRDLQYSEDLDLWSRAAQKHLYKWTLYSIIRNEKNIIMKSWVIRSFRQGVVRYMDGLRLGRHLFNAVNGKNVTHQQRLAEICAKLILPFYDSYANNFNSQFDCADSKYFIRLN